MPSRDSGAADTGRFFFDAGDATAIARAWMALNPDEAAATVRRAEQILTHRFPLLGYEAVDFGNPGLNLTIDWQLDPIHHRRAPLIPFGSIPYLDFNAVGDHKIVWELSRHQVLVTLTRAYLFSEDDRFAAEAIALWRRWIADNPYPLGIHWTSTLEVAFRILSWMWMDHMLAGSRHSTTKLRQELASHIAHGAWFIRRYLSTYFAPNTHLLGEAYAMFAAGQVYSGFRDSASWAEDGWRILDEEARNQVLADGFHFEQSTYYHVYALDFFLHARVLGARNGRDVQALDDAIRRMSAGLGAISQAGLAPRFGDDDGGRLFDAARNQTRHMMDPLATAAVLFENSKWKTQAGHLREESLWLLGTRAVEVFDKVSPNTLEPVSVRFADSGHNCLAQESGVLIADTGLQGWGNGGHGHADALSVQLIAKGEALITDPGTGSYPAEKPERNRYRQTAAHSTLEIDGRGQAETGGSFKWQRLTVTEVDHWHVGRAASFLAAHHDGYQRLADPVIHSRSILSWDGSGWLVFDRAVGHAAHRFNLRWQLPPDAKAVPCESGWSVGYSGAKELKVIAASQRDRDQWSWQLEPALYSPAYGAFEESSQLVFRASQVQEADVATVLSISDSMPRLEALPAATSVCSVYEWSDSRGRRRVWLGSGGRWNWAGLGCDAALLVVAADAQGALSSVCMASVHRLDIDGSTVLEAAAEIPWLEWSPGDSAPHPAWNPELLMKLL